MTDQRLDSDEAAPWLNLADAASRLGISVDALRAKIKRQGWRTQKGNDGRLLVQVAGLDATEQRRDGDQARLSEAAELAELLKEQDDIIAELHVELARAEERLEAARAVAIAEAEAAKRVAEADVRAVQAEVQAKEQVIAELRAMLVEARRPWWRRWLGD